MPVKPAARLSLGDTEAMPPENVEIVRRLYEAMDARNFAAIAELADHDAEWVAHLWTLEDGLVVRGEGFGDRDKALQAAGLSD